MALVALIEIVLGGGDRANYGPTLNTAEDSPRTSPHRAEDVPGRLLAP